MPDDKTPQDSIAQALTEISESVTNLVHDEIELAKTEVVEKVSSLARGGAAIAAGAVFGIFAVIFLLETIAWALNDIFVSGAKALWVGFLIVFLILAALAVAAFLFAKSKLKVGAPTPNMAIDEAKKIRETVTAPRLPAGSDAGAQARIGAGTGTGAKN